MPGSDAAQPGFGADAPAGFVSVGLSPPPAMVTMADVHGDSRIEIVLRNGRAIRSSIVADPNLLARLVAVLEGEGP